MSTVTPPSPPLWSAAIAAALFIAPCSVAAAQNFPPAYGIVGGEIDGVDVAKRQITVLRFTTRRDATYDVPKKTRVRLDDDASDLSNLKRFQKAILHIDTGSGAVILVEAYDRLSIPRQSPVPPFADTKEIVAEVMAEKKARDQAPKPRPSPEEQRRAEEEAKREAARQEAARQAAAKAESDRKAAEDRKRRETAADAKLTLAKELLKDGKKDRAKVRLQEVARDYDGTAAAAEARRLLKDMP